MSVNIVRSSKFTYYKLIDTKMQGLKYYYSYSYWHGVNVTFALNLYFLFKKEIINIHMFIHYEYRALLISQFSAEHIVFNIE